MRDLMQVPEHPTLGRRGMPFFDTRPPRTLAQARADRAGILAFEAAVRARVAAQRADARKEG